MANINSISGTSTGYSASTYMFPGSKNVKKSGQTESDGKSSPISQFNYALLEVNIQSYRSVTNAQGETTTVQSSMKMRLESIYANLSSAKSEAASQKVPGLNELVDYFSPENTAARIVNFALSRFQGEGVQEDRQKYADYIMPAIQKGFSEARAMLGAFNLPQEVWDQIDETYGLVEKMMDDFIKIGKRPGTSDTSAPDNGGTSWGFNVVA
ncbi:MAG: DUF5610 domain-containing protein [Planctomycetes bacterium]|nr:DUF5610 domain-containing protein [Planctomycetota bacterium]